MEQTDILKINWKFTSVSGHTPQAFTKLVSSPRFTRTDLDHIRPSVMPNTKP